MLATPSAKWFSTPICAWVNVLVVTMYSSQSGPSGTCCDTHCGGASSFMPPNQ